MDQKSKILIVDDDKFLLDMYSLKFSERGFEVATALSADDALAQFNAGFQPAIFLVDLIMPGMDGFQLVEKLRAAGADKRAAIILLSNLGQKEDIEKGLGLGVDGYIIKASATPSEVVSKVSAIAEQSRAKIKND
ncbi:MAG: response regulator [Candidatus Vogelbacteria bacterium]|nr:response regulator [Candidatus Vogelbacteria bacterium]